MNKNYLFGFLILLAIGLVTAGYVVNSYVITTDVIEPFEVEYAIAQSDDTAVCDAPEMVWFAGTDFTVPGFYPGESRVICVKINNSAPVDLAYELSGGATAGDCAYAFGSPSLTGSATAETVIIDGTVVTVPADASAVTGCEISLSVARG